MAHGWVTLWRRSEEAHPAQSLDAMDAPRRNLPTEAAAPWPTHLWATLANCSAEEREKKKSVRVSVRGGCEKGVCSPAEGCSRGICPPVLCLKVNSRFVPPKPSRGLKYSSRSTQTPSFPPQCFRLLPFLASTSSQPSFLVRVTALHPIPSSLTHTHGS